MKDHSSTPRIVPHLVLAALAFGACSNQALSTPSITPRDANAFIACQPGCAGGGSGISLPSPSLTLGILSDGVLVGQLVP
jgi:hypothetical protein